MLAPALRRYVRDGTFQNLQQRLLHSFSGNIASDGGILVFAADLIDFINVDNAGLRAAHITLSRLQQLQDDIFHVLAHVSSFGEGSGVDNGEGYVEHAGQGLRQKRLAGSGGPDEQNVGLT